MKSFGRIGILMGGYSSEREISLKSGKAVYQALKSHGCQVEELDIVETQEDKILSFILEAKIDIAFIALHGRLGEDGVIQFILEKADIPYTGSGVKASRLAVNKVLSQELLKDNGIDVPLFIRNRQDNSP